MINDLFPLVKLVARQGPALGVIPVFNPSQSSDSQSILFVFSHYSILVPPFFSLILHEYSLVFTISLKYLLDCIARADNLQISSDEERLNLFAKPCGFAY